jgi:hypothetical protein
METVSAASLGLGVAFNLGLSYFFFYVAYPFIIWKLGLIEGGITMTCFSAILSYIGISFYDRSGRDWFGIEIIKEKLSGLEGKSRIGRLIAGQVKRGGPLTLVILSIKFDPFVTTVYLRHGQRKFKGLGFRDWIIFFSSAAIGNGYWIFITSGGWALLKYLGHHFFSPIFNP